MIDVFPSRLLSSPRRSGGLVMPFFQTVRAERLYRFSVNFLRFARFFERGALLKKLPPFSFLLLCGFAPSREPLAPSRRAARPDLFHAKARRREEENDMGLGVTLVRLSEQMFIFGPDGLGFTTRLWLSGSQKPSTPAPIGSAQF